MKESIAKIVQGTIEAPSSDDYSSRNKFCSAKEVEVRVVSDPEFIKSAFAYP